MNILAKNRIIQRQTIRSCSTISGLAGYLAAIEDVPALGELKDGEFTAKLETLLENA